MKTLPFAAALAAGSLAATGVALPAQAQQIEGLQVAPGNTVLTVTGTGRSSGTPDLAMFSAGVATTGATAGEALQANSAAMNKVVRALKAAGIADRDIQTSNLNLNPVYADRTRTPGTTPEQELPRIVGYRASNQVMVKQRKLDQFGKVIDTLVSAGANTVNGPDFQLENPDAALDKARREAMTKARERANLYADAAGLRVVRILSITESGGYSPRPPMPVARMAADMAEAAPVEAGEVEVQANVTILFELAP